MGAVPFAFLGVVVRSFGFGEAGSECVGLNRTVHLFEVCRIESGDKTPDCQGNEGAWMSPEADPRDIVVSRLDGQERWVSTLQADQCSLWDYL